MVPARVYFMCVHADVCARSVYPHTSLRPPTCLYACVCMCVAGKREQRAGLGLAGPEGRLPVDFPNLSSEGVPSLHHRARGGSEQAVTGPGSGPQGANDQPVSGELGVLSPPWVSRPLGSGRKWGRKQGGGGRTDQSASRLWAAPACPGQLETDSLWAGQSARS